MFKELAPLLRHRAVLFTAIRIIHADIANSNPTRRCGS